MIIEGLGQQGAEEKREGLLQSGRPQLCLLQWQSTANVCGAFVAVLSPHVCTDEFSWPSEVGILLAHTADDSPEAQQV